MKWRNLVLSLLLVIPLTLQRSTPARSESNTGLFNMSYLFFGSTSSYVGQVDKTKGSLNVVSPNYFDITKDGQLDITWRLTTSFINEMHKRGIRVVPFLANHWDATAGINGLLNRDKLARDIAAAIEKYNLDGVDVDIEGIGHTYRDTHTDFIRLLRQYIPSNKEVSVAVAANPNGWKTGWQGFYDYNGLGKYANYLMIMAYDESWESPESPIGPVSSLSFFEKSIQFAINQGVPKERIVVGLPFYGRMWKLDGPTLEGKAITGMGVASSRVQPLVNQYNGSIKFDDSSETPYATFTIPPGQNTYIGSTNLTQGNYKVWFENETSIKTKLHLPSIYGIRGTGSWALTLETPEIWDTYTAALNWGGSQNIVMTYGSGTIGVTTALVNVRSIATTNGSILRTLSANQVVKVMGQPITSDNVSWYPIQLDDGKSGFVETGTMREINLNELFGLNRYETSTTISTKGWSDSSNVVVLGRGDIPIDALTGSVLAKKYQAPLLLTASSDLPLNVEMEIDRLKPTTIYLLGGEGAISASIQHTLQQKGYNVTRLTGMNRYATSVNVANQVGGSNEIFLTTGKNSPDPLSVAPYAGMKQIPIILTQPNTLPAEVRTFIREKAINKVTIIGGEGAVSGTVADELRTLGVTAIERVSGKDRYETSVAIAKRYKSEYDLTNIYFASGVSYVDALPGSPMAAMNRSPIILVNNSTIPTAVHNLLQTDIPPSPTVNILGGYGVISAATRTNLFLTFK